jgi:hypothetical protein
MPKNVWARDFTCLMPVYNPLVPCNLMIIFHLPTLRSVDSIGQPSTCGALDHEPELVADV